jgi:hypothetical protein
MSIFKSVGFLKPRCVKCRQDLNSIIYTKRADPPANLLLIKNLSSKKRFPFQLNITYAQVADLSPFPPLEYQDSFNCTQLGRKSSFAKPLHKNSNKNYYSFSSYKKGYKSRRYF